LLKKNRNIENLHRIVAYFCHADTLCKAGFLMLFLSANVLSNAQRPIESNPFSLEGGLSFTNGSTFSSPSLALRYFVKDNLAVRVGYGGSFSKQQNFVYGFDQVGMPTQDSLGTITTSFSSTSFAVGCSYHVSQLDKLSPYFFMDVTYIKNKDKVELTNTNGSVYRNGVGGEITTSNFGLGSRLGAGVDYYFAPNIFVGLELGLLFALVKDGTGSSTFNDGTTETSISVLPSSKEFYFTNYTISNVRIGWRF
jgi:opacity protein-like surface antigen